MRLDHGVSLASRRVQTAPAKAARTREHWTGALDSARKPPCGPARGADRAKTGAESAFGPIMDQHWTATELILFTFGLLDHEDANPDLFHPVLSITPGRRPCSESLGDWFSCPPTRRVVNR